MEAAVEEKQAMTPVGVRVIGMFVRAQEPGDEYFHCAECMTEEEAEWANNPYLATHLVAEEHVNNYLVPPLACDKCDKEFGEFDDDLGLL